MLFKLSILQKSEFSAKWALSIPTFQINIILHELLNKHIKAVKNHYYEEKLLTSTIYTPT